MYFKIIRIYNVLLAVNKIDEENSTWSLFFEFTIVSAFLIRTHIRHNGMSIIQIFSCSHVPFRLVKKKALDFKTDYQNTK